MKCAFIWFGVCLLVSGGLGKSFLDTKEDSVVSVYTTIPTTSGTNAPLDVYHQIAHNIAEKFTSPIYRFLGLNITEERKTSTLTPLDNIELEDEKQDSENVTDFLVKPLEPVDNDIAKQRDVEELSDEARRKVDGKPEKVVLYSSYLPVKVNENDHLTLDDVWKVNDTINDVDNEDNDSFDIDFDADNNDEDKPREGAFTYFLELIASWLQLAWGTLAAIFHPSNK